MFIHMPLKFGVQPLFHQIFEQRVVDFPSQKAVQSGLESVTYQDLNVRANQLANFLVSEHKIEKEDRIAIVLSKSFDVIISFLAVLKAGATVVLLDDPLLTETRERFRYCLGISNPKLIITESKYQEYLASEDAKLLCLENAKDKIKLCGVNNLDLNYIDEKTLAYITFTSGSTGNPKGVLIEHQGLYARIAAHNNLLKINEREQDFIAQFCPLSVDAVIIEIMLALGTGACLDLVPLPCLENLDKLTQYFNEQKINIAIFTPTVLSKLSPDAFSELLRAIITTGESVTWELLKRWLGLNRKIINGYGPCEVSICSTLWEYDGGNSITIGRAIPGVDLYLISFDDGSLIAESEQGKEGEIYIGGLGLARNYLNAETKYKERFVNILGLGLVYKTGDKGYYDNKKNVVFTGRIDRQVKKYGRLIYPEEIEKRIAQHPQIATAHVDIVGLNRQIYAYVSFRETTQNSGVGVLIYAVARSCKEYLPVHMLPGRWCVGGKAGVSNWKYKADKASQIYVANSPRKENNLFNDKNNLLNRIFIILKEIWAKILFTEEESKIFSLDIEDDFFLMGGDSLLYKIMVTEFCRSFPAILFPSNEFKEKPTISFLANYLLSCLEVLPAIPLNTMAQYTDHRRLPLFCIHSLLGNAINDYRELALEIVDRAVYGISARGLERSCLQESVEEKAADYIRVVKNIQKTGPYLLLGWSYGGVVVREMAEQFRREGQVVTIYILDSVSPTFLQQGINPGNFAKYTKKLAELTWRYINNVADSSFVEMPSASSDKSQQVEFVFNRLEERFLLGVHFLVPNPREIIALAKSHAVSMLNHFVSDLSADDYLFVADDKTVEGVDDNLGWSWKRGQAINIFRLPGDHSDIVKKGSGGYLSLVSLLKKFLLESDSRKKMSNIKKVLLDRYSNNFALCRLTPINMASAIKEFPHYEVEVSNISMQIDCLESETNKVLDVDDLFIDGRIKNIFIHSSYGLSVFCKKIAYGWSKGLWSNRFDYVFFIAKDDLPVRSNPYENLLDLIIDVCFKGGVFENDVIKIFKENFFNISHKVLVIFEGVDTYPDENSYLFSVSDLNSALNRPSIVITSHISSTEGVWRDIKYDVKGILKVGQKYRSVLVNDLPLQDRKFFQTAWLHAKKEFEADHVREHLSFYVLPRVFDLVQKDEKQLLDVFNIFLFQRSDIFLLKSNSGFGKTLASVYFERMLWEVFFRGESPYIPFRLQLVGVKNQCLQDLVVARLKALGIKGSVIKQVGRRFPFVFFLDDYDKLPPKTASVFFKQSEPNVFNFKSFVTCRNFDENISFSNVQAVSLAKYELRGFLERQWMDYISTVTMVYEGFSRRAHKIVKNNIVSCMRVNPFVWGTLLQFFNEKHSKSIFDFCDYLIGRWLFVGADRVSRLYACDERPDFFVNLFKKYCYYVSLIYYLVEELSESKSVLEKNEDDNFNISNFKSTFKKMLHETIPVKFLEQIFKDIFKGVIKKYGLTIDVVNESCFVEKQDDGTFFSQEIFQFYFLALVIKDSIRSRFKVEVPKLKFLEKQPKVYIRPEVFLKNTNFQEILLGALLTEEAWQEQLMSHVEQSRYVFKRSINNAAACSITLLGMSGFDFFGRNFDGLYIPYARLPFVILQNVRMTNAHLEGVSFGGAFLRNVDFSGSHLENTQFNESRHLQYDGCVDKAILIHELGYIALIQENELCIFDLKTVKKIKSFRFHKKYLKGIAYLESSRVLVAVAADGVGYTINLNEFHADPTALSIDAEGISVVDCRSGQQFIFVGNVNGFVSLYEVASKRCLRKFHAHDAMVSALACTRNEKRVLTANCLGEVKEWSVENEKVELIREYQSNIKDICAVRYGLNDRVCVAIGSEGMVQVWSASAGEQLFFIKSIYGELSALAIDNERESFVLGGANGMISEYSLATGLLLNLYRGHRAKIAMVAYDQESNLISVDALGVIKQWDVNRKFFLHKEQDKFILPTAITMAKNYKGRPVLVVGAMDGSLYLWRMKQMKFLNAYQCHNEAVTVVKYDETSGFLYTGSSDCLIKCWIIQSGEMVREYKGHKHSITSIEFYKKGLNFYLVSSDVGSNVCLWLDSEVIYAFNFNHNFHPYFSSHTLSKEVLSLLDRPLAKYSRDNRYLIGVDLGGVSVWMVDTGERAYTVSGSFNGISFSYDNEYFAVGCHSGIVEYSLTSMKTHGLYASDIYDIGDVVCVAYGPGTCLASGSKDKKIYIWDTEKKAIAHIIEGHDDVIMDVYFVDFNMLVSTSYDGSIKLWKNIEGSSWQLYWSSSHFFSAKNCNFTNTVLLSSEIGEIKQKKVIADDILKELNSLSHDMDSNFDLIKVSSGKNDLSIKEDEAEVVGKDNVQSQLRDFRFFWNARGAILRDPMIVSENMISLHSL